MTTTSETAGITYYEDRTGGQFAISTRHPGRVYLTNYGDTCTVIERDDVAALVLQLTAWLDEGNTPGLIGHDDGGRVVMAIAAPVAHALAPWIATSAIGGSAVRK